MPKAIDPDIRSALFRLADEGVGPAPAARRLGIGESSARRLLLARRQGHDALLPCYAPCGQHQRRQRPWHAPALALRRDRPGWGAKRVKVELKGVLPAGQVPSARALARFFRRSRTVPAPAGRPPAERADRSTVPHEVWQVDAVEQETLADGSQASWLRFADEATGAALATDVFAAAHFNQVPVGEVQARFRAAFARWGLPKAVQVDNGSPWGATGELPTPLALWLAGLGLDLRHTPPRTPTRNGVVERSHQTAQRWAEPRGCEDAEELQRRLRREDKVQRELYPYLGEASRMQACPGLAHSGRRYAGSEERSGHWSWQRALDRLGQVATLRTVDGSGKIGLWGGKAYVGVRLARRRVLVQFDAQARQWLVASESGAHLCRLAFDQVGEEEVLALPMTPPDPRRRFE